MSKFDDAFSKPKGRTDRSAMGAVAKSLWSRLMMAGHDGSAAGTISWCIIKASHPDLAGHEEALASLRRRSASELAELRDLATECDKTATMRKPERAAIVKTISDTLSKLRRDAATPVASPSPSSGVAPRARTGAVAAGFPSREEMPAILARAQELEADGAEPEEASDRAIAEWRERKTAASS